MQPIAEQSMTWTCAKCGKRPWSHAEHCACGEARPEPPPAAEPTDIALAEEASDAEVASEARVY